MGIFHTARDKEKREGDLEQFKRMKNISAESGW